MAAQGLDIDREAFCCSICLDLLKDPVTIPCGHSYCMSCVNTHWDGEGKSYSCPQCRQNFTQRPVLVKNTMLSILMEGLKKSGPPAALVSPPSAAHGDVSCDLCCEKKVKAVKSCLQCLVSYCKEHLQPHYDVAALKKHKLVEPKENLQENMCPRHDEVMKMFCRTDQQCICYLCSVDQHKGHHTVTAAAERAEKQRELQAVQQNLLQRIHHKETDEERLQQQVKNSSRSADAAVEHSDRSLKELLRLLEKRMSEVKQQVRSQQKAEEHRVKELQDKVQQEITELRRKLTELDTLSHTEDHVHFLHKFASLSKVSETSDSVKSSQTPPPFHDTVTAAVSKLRSALQETRLMDPPAEVRKPKVNTPKTNAPPAGGHRAAPPQQTSLKDFPTLPNLNRQPSTSDSQRLEPVANLPPQPSDLSNLDTSNLEDVELQDLLRYSRRLTFDPQSLNYKLELSKGDRVVKRLRYERSYPPHPDRFLTSSQVMTKESLTGRCFWQVLANYEDGFAVAASYRSIPRGERVLGQYYESDFGQNDVSWILECYSDFFFLRHDSRTREIRFEDHESYPPRRKLEFFWITMLGFWPFTKF
uniref:Tripartite motif-containing protein 16-like n=1 Tax=Neogobius melanostomus TaxID=47308 RepID=A0A8C6UM24_9GOBI